MLRDVDLLAPNVFLRADGNENQKSNVGGFFTVIVVLLAIGAFFGFGMDIFLRSNPTVTFNKVINDEPFYRVNSTNFLFAIYDQWSDLPFEEFERKFYPYLDHMYFDGKGSNNITKYPFVKCGSEALERWRGTFFNIPSNYLCLPDGVDITVRGIFGDGAHDLLRVQTIYCKNNTDPNSPDPIRTDCYDRDFITSNITGRIQMHYIMESSNMDTINYKAPGSTIPLSGLSNTNAESWNRLTVLFKNTLVETDTGFFTQDLRNDVYSGVESALSETVYTIGTDTIFSHLMGNSKYKDVYIRKYIKIQDVFALMGGFINGSRICLCFVVKYMSRFRLVNLFNNLYKFKPVKPLDQFESNSNVPGSNTTLRNKTHNFFKEEDGRTTTTKMNNFTNKVGATDEVQKANLLKEAINTKASLNYEYSFSIPKRVLRGICGSKKWKRYLASHEQVEEKMSKVMSVEGLVKTIRNFKLMKMLTLQEYHLKLLGVCPLGPKKGKKMLTDEHLTNVTEDMKKQETSKMATKCYEYVIANNYEC